MENKVYIMVMLSYPIYRHCKLALNYLISATSLGRGGEKWCSDTDSGIWILNFIYDPQRDLSIIFESDPEDLRLTDSILEDSTHLSVIDMTTERAGVISIALG